MSLFGRILDKLTGNDVKRLENRITQLTKALKSWKAEYSNLKPEFDNVQLEAQALRDTNKDLNKQLQNELAQRLRITSEYNTKLAQMQDAIKILYSQIDLLKEAAITKEIAPKIPQQDPKDEPVPPMAVDITSLSENELKIIRYLQKNPGSRQKEIFADLKMNKATVSNVLKGLVEKSIMSKNESRGTYQCRELSSMS